jgi:biopolymer transport protein ExbD
MKIRHSTGGLEDRIQLQMVPMIDVVFQMLVFFLFTLKISGQEGDFNVKMPLAASTPSLPADDRQLPPMKVRLQADTDGELVSISLNDNSFGSFQELHQFIMGFIGNETGPGSTQESAEVELDCDYNLRYEYVVTAITAVLGHIDEKTGQVIKLVEKVKFAPPRSPAVSSP